MKYKSSKLWVENLKTNQLNIDCCNEIKSILWFTILYQTCLI